MAFVSQLRYRYAPEAIALFILTLLFVSLLPLPYFIHSDAPTSLKSSQQFAQGLTERLGDLWLPDINDLSQNQSFWMIWFSPGMAFLYYPLLALGLPLGLAAKITSYLLMMSGCGGWLAVAKKLKLSQVVLILFALALPFYAVSVSGVWLSTAEIVVFAIMPWIYQFGLGAMQAWQNPNQSWFQTLKDTTILGLCLGSSYFLKYSAIIPALSFCLYLTIELLFVNGKHRFQNHQKLIILGLGFCTLIIIPLILSLFNAQNGNTTNYLDASIAVNFSPNHPRGFYLLIGLISAPALYLFQASQFWIHLIFFSDGWIPFFRGIAFEQRIIPLTMITFPFGLFLLMLCWRYRHSFSRPHWLLFITLGYLPFLPLAYLSQKIGYNYLAFNSRHGVGHALIIELLMLAIFWEIFKHQQERHQWIFKSVRFVKLTIIFLIFYIIPNAFHLMHFAFANHLNFPRHYIANQTQIYNPSLSIENSKIVLETIDGLKKSQQDVIILAMHEPSAFTAWLDVDGRVLPIAFSDEMFRTALQSDALNLYSDRPFFTSQPLQVILVVSKFIEADSDWLTLIKRRFPQAQTWSKHRQPALNGAAVSIYIANLTP
ncbi:hypothetical protein VB712_12925 [Spirulina sp. CCNP1310]|uniref:hypothetical protein n=1 Tax=Spirulina sp. CCNP1310 TaxID=3110249 RepID=UPI002B217238|nr:hypothetical protein [Spirulina sp. CCNP1310]MEA5420126.1 hypothetical protein [Spirulina sp. CCNP1310]